MHYTSEILIFHLIRSCNRYISILTVYQVIKRESKSVDSKLENMTYLFFVTSQPLENSLELPFLDHLLVEELFENIYLMRDCV